MKTLYWVDDTHDQGKPPKPQTQGRLEKGLGVHLSVKTVRDRKEFDELLSKIDGRSTCGVIMDYQLTKVGEGGQMAYGSSWASEIRAACPSVPVIGISHEREIDIPKLRLEQFLAFFPRQDLLGPQPPLANLSALLDGYRLVYEKGTKQNGKTGVDLAVALTKPPKSIIELLASAIPPLLRGNWDAETPHIGGRWIWHELQGRPGFLFDELSLATHLGLNIEGFRKIRSNFEPARYQGAFASEERARWWVTGVRKVFETIVNKTIVGSLAGSRIDLLSALKIQANTHDALLSTVHGRRNCKEIPDCVAYRDDEREENDRIQTLSVDTYVDERDANPPFGFEARRIFGPTNSK
jgi:hypothetical protein